MKIKYMMKENTIAKNVIEGIRQHEKFFSIFF